MDVRLNFIKNDPPPSPPDASKRDLLAEVQPSLAPSISVDGSFTRGLFGILEARVGPIYIYMYTHILQ